MTPEEQQYAEALRRQQMEQAARSAGAGAYVPPQDKYGGAITTLTDPEKDLDKFEMFLRSQRYDINGNTVQIGKKPLMNEEGINAIMSIIESVVYQTNSMTNYDKSYLEGLYDNLKADLIHILMTKRLQFDVDRKDRFLIVGDSIRFVWGFALKSFQEGERKFWKGSTQEVRHIEETNKPSMTLNPFSYFRRK